MDDESTNEETSEPSEKTEAVTEEVTEEAQTEGDGETPTEESPEEKPPKGYVPYQSLEEERRKRKELQQEVELLKSSMPSDEGEIESDEIRKVTERINLLERKETLRELETANPYLKDRKAEFEDFLEDEENKGIPLRKAAKLFLAEQGQVAPERKGTEKPTGGPSAPPKTGLSREDVEKLRTENFKEYEKLLKAGKISFK